jgi:hypothetical protein
VDTCDVVKRKPDIKDSIRTDSGEENAVNPCRRRVKRANIGCNPNKTIITKADYH